MTRTVLSVVISDNWPGVASVLELDCGHRHVRPNAFAIQPGHIMECCFCEDDEPYEQPAVKRMSAPAVLSNGGNCNMGMGSMKGMASREVVLAFIGVFLVLAAVGGAVVYGVALVKSLLD